VTADPAETPRPLEIRDGEPTVVYRFYAADGRLLYVGITCHLAARFARHAAEKYWWPQVAKKTAVLYPAREDALAEEARAILEESPLHNVAGREESGRETTYYKRMARMEESISRTMAQLQSWTVQFSPETVRYFDEVAESRQCSRIEAMFGLIHDGMIKFLDDKSADLDAQIAELRAKSGQESSAEPVG
jgi:hypothetical protein